MKHRLYFSCLFICSCTWLFAQKNINQKMVDKLEGGNYWEAKKFYSYLKTWGYALEPSIESFYKYSMADFQSKPDSAVVYLEDVLREYRPFGLMNIEFYFRLWRLYTETLQDYEKALSTCSLIRSYIEENPDGGDNGALSEWDRCVSDWERQTLRRMQEPPIRISRDDSKNTTAIVSDSIINDLLFFEAIYNEENKIKTVFDTGVTEYFSIDSNIAKKIGVRRYPIYDNDTIGTLNGREVQGYSGILDSVRIANITLYNIPVFIWDRKSLVNVSDSVWLDSLKKEELNNFYHSFDVVVGLKAMSLIGKIKLNWTDKVLCFPTPEEEIFSGKDPNIFIFTKKLFTQIKINNLSLTAFVDTGDNEYVTIDSWFYEKHKKDIPIDTLTEKDSLNRAMFHDIRQNIPHEIADNPSITFNGKVLNIEKNNKVYISSLKDWNTPDATPANSTYLDITEGVVGYDFFKHLGEEILFDFRNMRIDILEQKK
ncbi:hypothetical protein D0T84_21390 [Dysgonomonas sp. 521]|uniref:retropepsin-like aspartic protease n=1 Tax=Dysgonomonas sp. 521 TaxID=2302932 RepID=UPI0013D15FB9|nr:retropepsin-like aspartic protease [Dysgonomonas sp. 521]NDV97431.1 hypothetical protein [Dysgonomonas sp. 521]